MKKTISKIKPLRVGILLYGLENANVPALKYLVLCLNTLQNAFEHEFLPVESSDQIIRLLSNKRPVSREQVRKESAEFVERYMDYLTSLNEYYGVDDVHPDHYILITMTKFSDNFYVMRQGSLSVLALGNWKTIMAPPSLLEFVLTLIIRESLPIAKTTLLRSVHLGTKGCLFDFTAELSDVRYKVLNHFVCAQCRTRLLEVGHPELADELLKVLKKDWFGRLSDPSSPASITLKLGYNLFTTKGFDATRFEKFLLLLQEEGVKQLISIVGAIIIAGLLLWLGLK